MLVITALDERIFNFIEGFKNGESYKPQSLDDTKFLEKLIEVGLFIKNNDATISLTTRGEDFYQNKK